MPYERPNWSTHPFQQLRGVAKSNPYCAVCHQKHTMKSDGKAWFVIMNGRTGDLVDQAFDTLEKATTAANIEARVTGDEMIVFHSVTTVKHYLVDCKHTVPAKSVPGDCRPLTVSE